MLTEQYVSVINAILRVIPEDEINVAIIKGQRDSREKWEWGDRALLWIEIALSSGIVCTKDQVYTALSQVSGIPKRTLRHYADHAKYFDLIIRAKYEPMPFAHFMVAKSYGPRSREVLDCSADYMESYGRHPTAEWLEWKFSRNAQPVLEADANLKEVTDEMFENMIAEDIMMPPYNPEGENDDAEVTQAQTRYSLNKMDGIAQAMNAAISLTTALTVERRARLIRRVNELRIEIEEAMREVSHPIPKGK